MASLGKVILCLANRFLPELLDGLPSTLLVDDPFKVIDGSVACDLPLMRLTRNRSCLINKITFSFRRKTSKNKKISTSRDVC